jgi:signal transduction histidine kinase
MVTPERETLPLHASARNESVAPERVSASERATRTEPGEGAPASERARGLGGTKSPDQELTQARQEVAQSHRDLQGLASIIANDLLEPLRTARTLADRISAALADHPDQVLDSARRIRQITSALLFSLNDLLSLTRIATMPLARQALGLRALLDGVRADLAERLSTKGGWIDVDVLPELYGDPTLIRELFEHVLDNAIKFHRPGTPPAVEVRAETILTDSAANAVWLITVEDNGIGFDPQYAERIFHPFERLENPGVPAGRGMGLALCRRIVERHGGSIRAEGTPGHGARILVTLPIPERA